MLRELVAYGDAGGATFVASLHAVDLALRWFPRIVGMRGGRVVFDLPASEVTPELLRALYAAQDDADEAAADGEASRVDTAPRMAVVTPLTSARP